MTSNVPGNDLFMQLTMGYRMTKAVLVANRLGLFEAIDGGATTRDAIAARAGVSTGKLGLLLQALCGLGLLRQENGAYALTEMASRHLLATSPYYVGNNLHFLELLWDNWSHLEDVVRSGKAWRGLKDLLGDDDQEFTRRYIAGMQNVSGPPSRDVARLLGAGSVRRFLDVGCGLGNYAHALLEANPGSTGVLLDLETTLSVTREYMQAFIDAERCELRVGDYLRDSYGEGFDLVLMSHTTHDEDDAGVLTMFQRAFAAMVPGGRLAIHDWIVAADGTPLSTALFALNLGVYTEGRVYSLDEYRALLERAGFANVTSPTVLEGKTGNPTSLVIAVKA